MDFTRPNFLNLDTAASDPTTSRVMILPLPLDITASWKRGTADGPAAIIEASHHVELYDDELQIDCVAAAGGIATHPAPELPTDPALAAAEIHELASELVRPGRLLISLGGEHSITFPLVRAHHAVWPDLTVVQIDAHADMRASYMGTAHNHACPMRRILELGIHVTSIGVRSVDSSETEFLRSERSRIYLASEVAGRLDSQSGAIVESLPSGPVYLTIDLDGLDPSVVPAVGTPVPGGLGWYETLAFIRRLCEQRQLVGADVVELAPRAGLHHAEAAAARLVTKLICYWSSTAR